MKNRRYIDGIIVIFIVLFGVFSLILLSPPKPVPSSAPLNLFSSERAMSHINATCNTPHWIGTEANRKVRDTIIAESKKLGLDTEIQTATVLDDKDYHFIARVENVIAILKGTKPGKGVMIAGHYDSQPNTPAATDDGSAVAAMLETARALKNAPPLKNDIIFLFTDGEEIGMAGARAFVEQHRLAKNIGIVFNLEARGNRGPSFTFEVSSGNGYIMSEYAKAIPYPFASSVMYEVYKQLPNNTDFTIFKRGGIPGFNAAPIDGFVNYHNMTDNPQNLDKSLLQHQGSYALNFARHFGNLDLDKKSETDEVYFNPIGSLFIHYPGSLNFLFVIIVFVLFIIYFILGIWQKRLTFKGTIGGFFIYLGSIAVLCGLTWGIQTAIKALYPLYSHYYANNFYNIHYYFLLFTLLTAGLFSLLYFLLFRKLKPENLFSGVITLFIIIMGAVYVKMPTAAFLVMYPLFFVLVAGIISFFCDFSEIRKYNIYAIIQMLAVLPAVALFSPMAKMLYAAFGLQMAFAGTALVLILLGFLVLQLKTAFDFNKYALPVLLLLGAVGAFISGHITSRPNEQQPLQTNLSYFLDGDRQKASWISAFLEPDDWNKSFFTSSRKMPLSNIFPLRTRGEYLENDAPLLNLPAPVVNVVEDRKDDSSGIRTLHLKVSSSRAGNLIYFFFLPKSNIIRTQIDGKTFSSAEIAYCAFPHDGFELVIERKRKDNSDDIEFVAMESTLGLPTVPGYSITLPPGFVPATSHNNFETFLKKTYKF